MKQKPSIGMLEKRRDAKLKELGSVGPVLQGSLTEIGVRCGNPNCRCARGEKHRSHVVKRQVNGKTQTTYVPVDMLEEARAWVQEHRRIQRLLREISELNRSILKSYVTAKRARGRNRASAKERRSRTASDP